MVLCGSVVALLLSSTFEKEGRHEPPIVELALLRTLLFLSLVQLMMAVCDFKEILASSDKVASSAVGYIHNQTGTCPFEYQHDIFIYKYTMQNWTLFCVIKRFITLHYSSPH